MRAVCVHRVKTAVLARYFKYLGLILILSCSPKSSPSLIIAAASDLVDAFTDLGKKFEETYKAKVIFSFGSSGLLARQIEEGAPFDLFAAANQGFIQKLEKKNLVLQGSETIYAQGRLALWQREDTLLTVKNISDLANPSLKRIAIAKPEHAPYGTAAKEALQQAGLWEPVKERIVFGENVIQTLQFAQTGNVDVAIVALSISYRPGGRHVAIEPKWHQPINQSLCILRSTKNKALAAQFVAFLNGPSGRAVMKQYGFVFPENSEE